MAKTIFPDETHLINDSYCYLSAQNAQLAAKLGCGHPKVQRTQGEKCQEVTQAW